MYFVPDASAAWWSSSYENYRKITVESDYIDNGLTNFPLLVTLDNSTGNFTFHNSGADIEFVSLDNTTRFNHEVESFDNSGNTSCWVNISEVLTSGSNYSFLVYYNNYDDFTVHHNPEDVWDSGYMMVMHLNETAGEPFDSTSNDNDGTYAGIEEDMTGKIAGAYGFNGSIYEYIQLDATVLPSSATCTMETWLYPYGNNTKNDAAMYIMDLGDQWYYRVNYRTWQDGGGQRYSINAYASDGAPINCWSAQYSCMPGSWYHVAWVYDGTTYRLYLDGTEVANSGVEGQPVALAQGSYIGTDFTGPGNDRLWFNGTIDESRVSSIGRNASWIKACFHNQNLSSHLGDFLSWGSEQSRPPGDPPVISNEYPTNNSIYICPTSVELGVTVGDADADSMNITFWSNLSGTWDYFYAGTINVTLVDVVNGTYFINPIYFTRYNHVYYWNASVTDGTYTTDSGVFSFTTSSSPCGKGGGGMVGGSAMYVVGVIGIFGLLGYFKHKRRHEK